MKTTFEPAIVVVFNKDLTEFEIYSPDGQRVTEQVKEHLLVVAMGLTNNDTGQEFHGVFMGANEASE
jgi:hypothetical protein